MFGRRCSMRQCWRASRGVRLGYVRVDDFVGAGGLAVRSLLRCPWIQFTNASDSSAGPGSMWLSMSSNE